MGISQAVAFSLIAMVALSTFISMAAIYERSQEIYNGALVKFQQWQVTSQDTKVTISEVTLSGEELLINISNIGSVNLYDYSHFSLIVDYYQNISGSAVHSLSDYSYSKSQNSYTWECENGIILPESSGIFRVNLPGIPYHGEAAALVISTSVGPSAAWSGVL